MSLRLSGAAEAEAQSAAAWYDQHQTGLGEDFLDEFTTALAEIEDDPRRFTRLETLRSRREFRRRLLSRFPYLIVYEVLPDEVIVQAVAHVSRRPNYWLRRTEHP